MCNDVELSFNPERFLSALVRANKAHADAKRDVRGARKRLSVAYKRLSESVVSQSSRVEKSRNRTVLNISGRSIEEILA